VSDCCQIHGYFAVPVEEFLAENKMTVIPCLLCSLDLALCDVFHFPKLKVVLKGRRFNGTILIQAKSWVIPAHCQMAHFM
jgi:hypothetical protein